MHNSKDGGHPNDNLLDANKNTEIKKKRGNYSKRVQFEVCFYFR